MPREFKEYLDYPYGSTFPVRVLEWGKTLKLAEHHQAESLVEVLRRNKPSRVFTSTQNALFNALSAVTFRDSDTTIHGFQFGSGNNDEFNAKGGKVWEEMEKLGLKEIDGTITIDDETLDIYEIFQTETPDDPEKVESQVKSWAEAVRTQLQQTPNETYLQYLHVDPENIFVDATTGRNHLVTSFFGHQGYTLDYLKSEFPGVKLQDNTPVVRWAKVLTNG